MRNMRAVIPIAIAVGLSGCATHRLQQPSVAEPVSTEWSTVLALGPQTSVVIALDDRDVRKGRVCDVSDATLCIWEYDGSVFVRRSIARAEIARVTVHEEVGPMNPRRDRFIGASLGSAFVGGLAGLIVATVQRNKTLSGASAAMFFGSIITAAEMEKRGYPRPKYEDRVVYVRP